MRLFRKVSGLAIGTVFLTYFAYGATITGTVSSPEGTPFKGAFVQARNIGTRITVSVLSGKDGRYQIPELPAGTYELRTRVTGYRTSPRTGISLSAEQSTNLDLTLEKGTVRWSDLSVSQGRDLLPDAEGKDLLFGKAGDASGSGLCFSCHDFQTRMASARRDEAGWRDKVLYMRDDVVPFWIGPRLTERDIERVSSYLNLVFGEDSLLPRSPADLPEYKETLRPVGDEALNIVYVEYELPGPNRMPWSAAPAADGSVWIPYYGKANKVGRLDPRTGQVQEFPVPFKGPAGIHSAVAEPDGTVWITESGSNRLARLDPKSKEVVEYQDAYLPGKEGTTLGGQKHTVRIDSKKNVWVTGTPFTRFDRKTGKFQRFAEIPTSYSLVFDRDENVWFTEFTKNGKLGRIDAKTGKVNKYGPKEDPENFFPHRIDIDGDGYLWLTARGTKVVRFDPKAETFKEFDLPGRDASNYAIAVDGSGHVWYSASHLDQVGKLDPSTGKITEYPFPYSEITMREFFFDEQGRMWWASPANNRVGYFYLTGTSARSSLAGPKNSLAK